MKKYSEICEEIQVETPAQKMLKTNTKYRAKILYDKEVDQILNLFKINERMGSKIYMKDPQKSNSKSSIICHALPLDLKLLNPSEMK